jgi:hypothetical protein
VKRLEAGHYEGAGFSVYRVEKTEWYSFSRGREGAWNRKVKYWNARLHKSGRKVEGMGSMKSAVEAAREMIAKGY